MGNTLGIYFDTGPLKRARAGNHNFVEHIRKAVAPSGWSVELRESTAISRAAAGVKDDFSLFHMEAPTHARALTFRHAYIGAFWRIERVANRAEFDVAKAKFEGASVEKEALRSFLADWRRWSFPDLPGHPRREGFVYVPLQARLTEQRTGQSMSPIEMISAVLAHEPKRWIVVTKHPRWTYSAEESAELQILLDADPRLTLGTAPAPLLLRDCDYVVTQNSSVAFQGMLFKKPAVLFARTDFHHIALNVLDLGAKAAITSAPAHRPDFSGYIYWFVKEQCIGGGQNNAADLIARRLTELGWPLAQ